MLRKYKNTKKKSFAKVVFNKQNKNKNEEKKNGKFDDPLLVF